MSSTQIRQRSVADLSMADWFRQEYFATGNTQSYTGVLLGPYPEIKHSSENAHLQAMFIALQFVSDSALETNFLPSMNFSSSKKVVQNLKTFFLEHLLKSNPRRLVSFWSWCDQFFLPKIWNYIFSRAVEIYPHFFSFLFCLFVVLCCKIFWFSVYLHTPLICTKIVQKSHASNEISL